MGESLTTRRWGTSAVAVLVSLGFVAAACGGDNKGGSAAVSSASSAAASAVSAASSAAGSAVSSASSAAASAVSSASSAVAAATGAPGPVIPDKGSGKYGQDASNKNIYKGAG